MKISQSTTDKSLKYDFKERNDNISYKSSSDSPNICSYIKTEELNQ